MSSEGKHMNKQTLHTNYGEMASMSMRQEAVPHPLEDRHTSLTSEPSLEEYYPKKWVALDRLYTFIDAKTGGRAAWFQRLFSFLFVGGLGAVANLLCFSALYYPLMRSLKSLVAYYIAFLLATELSIVINFALNDRITFRTLAGQSRPWKTRCVRFHLTSTGGALLTFVISFSCLHWLRIPAFLSQVIALVAATAFNFAFHHAFTYRHAPETNSRERSDQVDYLPRASTKGAQTITQGRIQPMKAIIIVPTYNEAENLPPLLESILSYAPTADILVVDDNSPDGTGRLAEEIRSKDARIHVMHRPGKLGLGAAYIAGFKYAIQRGYDAAFEMDADFSHDPRYLPDFMNAIEHADLIIGSRYIPGGSTPNWTLTRRLISGSGNIFARLMLGIAVHDCTGGFRCYRREVLENIDLDTVQSRGYAFQVELTYRTMKCGFKIVETPITFIDRVHGKSKMSRKIVLEAFSYVLRTRFSKSSGLPLVSTNTADQLLGANLNDRSEEVPDSPSSQSLLETLDTQRRSMRPVKLRNLR
jgi:dolichol-phosphate mannosyltransferase